MDCITKCMFTLNVFELMLAAHNVTQLHDTHLHQHAVEHLVSQHPLLLPGRGRQHGGQLLGGPAGQLPRVRVTAERASSRQQPPAAAGCGPCPREDRGWSEDGDGHLAERWSHDSV